MLSIYVYQLVCSPWHPLNIIMILLGISLAGLCVAINQTRREIKRLSKAREERIVYSDTTTDMDMMPYGNGDTVVRSLISPQFTPMIKEEPSFLEVVEMT